jgi:hypothetical protein
VLIGGEGCLVGSVFGFKLLFGLDFGFVTLGDSRLVLVGILG